MKVISDILPDMISDKNWLLLLQLNNYEALGKPHFLKKLTCIFTESIEIQFGINVKFKLNIGLNLIGNFVKKLWLQKYKVSYSKTYISWITESSCSKSLCVTANKQAYMHNVVYDSLCIPGKYLCTWMTNKWFFREFFENLAVNF